MQTAHGRAAGSNRRLRGQDSELETRANKVVGAPRVPKSLTFASDATLSRNCMAAAEILEYLEDSHRLDLDGTGEWTVDCHDDEKPRADQ